MHRTNTESSTDSKGLPEEPLLDYDYLFQTNDGKENAKKKSFWGRFILSNLPSILLSNFLYILQSAPTWAFSICSANVINLITQAVVGGSITKTIWIKLLINAAVIVAFILQRIPVSLWRLRVTSNLYHKVNAAIKYSVVRKLQFLSITYHKDVQTGKIQSKFLKDTEGAVSLFHAVVFTILPRSIDVVIAVVISLCYSPLVSLFFLVVIPFNVALSYFSRKSLQRRSHDVRVSAETMSARLSAMLEMIPVTKTHGLENQEIQSVGHSISGVASSGRQMDRAVARFDAWTHVVTHLLTFLCLALCSVLAIKKVIGVGEIVLYQSMFSSINTGMTAIVSILPTLSSGREAFASVAEIMQESNVELNIGKQDVPSITGDVTFENVSYKYPNTEEYVVKEFNLRVKAGECIAVVGSSGSGKSTLMNLIIGLLSPTEGSILIDGVPLNRVHSSQYRHNLSVVSQNTILFSGTIRENITYGLDCYDERDLQAVIEMANLEELIRELPQGLDTVVGEHGDKLSGGQKQRITIARALIRNPKILILDEATSALDNLSEYHVQQAIAKSVRGRTTFIVAHRLSTIRDADRIIVMEDGRAAEIGTYDELMERKGKFFALKQLTERNVKIAKESLES